MALPPFGTLAGEIARALLLSAGLGVLLGSANLWHRRRHPPVEWTRKLVHAVGGITCAFLPWLFAWHWTVLVLAGMLVLVMLAGRSRGLLPSVTEVDRTSRGELWFPVVVYLLFVVARHQPVFYLIALSSLTVSDTMAALLGSVYGRSTFTVDGSRKSLEGSAAFLLVTFLAVHLALLLGTGLDRSVCVIVALQIALLTASAEAISVEGRDNLVVPLGTYYLLLKLTPHTAAEVGLQLAVQVGMLVVMLLIAARTRVVTLGGAIAAHLVLYAAFSLGGPLWVVAPAGALAAFIVLDRRYGRAAESARHGHEVVEIYYVAIVAVLVLFTDNSLAALLWFDRLFASGHPFYPLFVGALAATLATSAFEIRERSPAGRRRPAAGRRTAAFAIAAAAVLVPGLAVMGPAVTLEACAAAVLPVAIGAAAFFALRGHIPAGSGVRSRLRVQSLCVLVAVALTLPLHFAWLDGRLRWPGR